MHLRDEVMQGFQKYVAVNTGLDERISQIYQEHVDANINYFNATTIFFTALATSYASTQKKRKCANAALLAATGFAFYKKGLNFYNGNTPSLVDVILLATYIGVNIYAHQINLPQFLDRCDKLSKQSEEYVLAAQSHLSKADLCVLQATAEVLKAKNEAKEKNKAYLEACKALADKHKVYDEIKEDLQKTKEDLQKTKEMCEKLNALNLKVLITCKQLDEKVRSFTPPPGLQEEQKVETNQSGQGDH